MFCFECKSAHPQWRVVWWDEHGHRRERYTCSHHLLDACNAIPGRGPITLNRWP